MSAALEVQDIRVAYGSGRTTHVAVDGLSLTLAPGEIGCLLGASGSGKTTVLRAIAGFEPLQAGRIALQGVDLAGSPPERRRIGMMFQDYALFPHLTVQDNVGFGLRRLARAERMRRIEEMLALVGLADRACAYPHQLSGGQQQRIALARAFAPAPALLLLDEPFSNLDADARQRLAAELRALLKAAAATALVVTHDQAEAFAIADGIGVMHAGRIAQWGDADTLYRAPADRYVAGFIGRGSWVPGEALGLGADVEVRLRPHHLRIATDGPIRAMLESTTFRGPEHVGVVRFATGATAEIALDAHDAAGIGETLRLRLIHNHLPVFPR